MDRSHREPLVRCAAPECVLASRARTLPEAGFTLVEVLVALAVVTTMMTALVLAGSSRVDGLSYMRDRTIATWIASNRLTGLRLARDWPDTGTREGEVEAVGRTWRWHAEISNTPDNHVRRVEITVRLDESDDRLSRMVGFVIDPDIRAVTEETS